MQQLNRRRLIGLSGSAFAVALSGALSALSPAQARAENRPLTHFNGDQARALEAVAELLVPGSAIAGVVNFIDGELSRPVPLLMARYLGVEVPKLTAFYQSLANALMQALTPRDGKVPDMDLVAQRLADGVESKDWPGPPMAICYLALRGDGCDVVYGTTEGFAQLGTPYMAHIQPPVLW